MSMKKQSNHCFPRTATSYGVLLLTSALTAFNPKSVNVDNEKKKCISRLQDYG
jgi:hypothetical protein